MGRSHSELVPPEVKTLALSHEIPVWQPEKIGEVAEDLKKLAPDFIVVMAYGQMIGKAVRESASKAIINLHASLLPKYRGASCIQSAIANGEEETGITIMHVIRELDAGAIICKKSLRIQDTETAEQLHDRLANLGPAALSEAMEILQKNPQAGTEQDAREVSYAPKLLRDHGRIDFQGSASEIERMIRGYHPWPGTFTEVLVKGKSKRLKIFPPIQVSAEALAPGEWSFSEGKLYVGCGEASLQLFQVQPEGGKIMPAEQLGGSWFRES